ncbi:hypothetical protein JT359_05755 [Candidatus Poribacteria bacterium]|nr:hypothetical protein [Candidatus Poribacteria bacterium]
MTKRRAFRAIVILILLVSSIGVFYFLHNYEIKWTTYETLEYEVKKTPETEQLLKDSELVINRLRQSVKPFTKNDKAALKELDRFLNFHIHKQIVPKVKSRVEITRKLSSLSDEEWRIQQKEFEEKMKRVREEIKKDTLTPALSPLEIKQKYLQQLAELTAWNESVERRFELFYANRIRTQLTKIPPEKREEAMVGIRQELDRTWDADFINAVMQQLQQEK